MTPEERVALEERFWSKVQRGLRDDCWEWTRHRHVKWNYGHFRWKNPITGKSEIINAHRVAFYLTFDYLPEMGCHTCDNPPCCNPVHIYDGDAVTNGADKADRRRARGNRNQRGESNKVAVLTEAMVIEARRRVNGGETATAVASSLGVQRATLSYAVVGKTWSHLNEIAPPVQTKQRRTT